MDRTDPFAVGLCVRSIQTRTYSPVPVPVLTGALDSDRDQNLDLDSGVGRMSLEKFQPYRQNYTVLESRFRDTRCTDFRLVLELDPVPGSVGPHLRLDREHRVGRKVAVGLAVDYTVIERVVLEELAVQEGTRLRLTVTAVAVVAAAVAAVGCSKTVAVVVDVTVVTGVSYYYYDSESVLDFAAM